MLRKILWNDDRSRQQIQGYLRKSVHTVNPLYNLSQYVKYYIK